MISRAESPCRAGAVSFFNTLPLIDGLEQTEGVELVLDVPARLADRLVAGETDLSLCSVIDQQRGDVDLELVPVGIIGSDGATDTVALFSREPFEAICEIACDIDSHTSVALLKIIMLHVYGRTPELTPYDAKVSTATPDAVLLIGDKVARAAPPSSSHPHRLDLGLAWKSLTGRPFVFGAWFRRCDDDSAGRTRAEQLAVLLDHRRRANRGRIDSIIARHGPSHGWEPAAARTYLCDRLRFTPTPERIEAIRHFHELAARVGAIDRVRPLRVAAFT